MPSSSTLHSVNPSQSLPASGVFISAWRKAPPQPLYLLQRHVHLLSCLLASSQRLFTLALPSVAAEVLPRPLMRCDMLMGSLLFISSEPLMLSQANQPLAAPRSPLGKNRGILGLAGRGSGDKCQNNNSCFDSEECAQFCEAQTLAPRPMNSRAILRGSV